MAQMCCFCLAKSQKRRQKTRPPPYVYVYIYIYMCVCVCVCVCARASFATYAGRSAWVDCARSSSASACWAFATSSQGHSHVCHEHHYPRCSSATLSNVASMCTPRIKPRKRGRSGRHAAWFSEDITQGSPTLGVKLEKPRIRLGHCRILYDNELRLFLGELTPARRCNWHSRDRSVGMLEETPLLSYTVSLEFHSMSITDTDLRAWNKSIRQQLGLQWYADRSPSRSAFSQAPRKWLLLDLGRRSVHLPDLLEQR